MSITIFNSSRSRWRYSRSSYYSITNILLLPISNGSLRYYSNLLLVV